MPSGMKCEVTAPTPYCEASQAKLTGIVVS